MMIKFKIYTLNFVIKQKNINMQWDKNNDQYIYEGTLKHVKENFQ